LRYSKLALLLFGAGMLLGLIVVAGEIGWLGRTASAAMAFGIVALPVGLVVDLRRHTPAPPCRGKPRKRRSPAAAGRPPSRKSASASRR